MTNQDIEVIPVEQSFSQVPSTINTKGKHNSSSNAHHFKNRSIHMNKRAITLDFSTNFDISFFHKIKIAK